MPTSMLLLFLLCAVSTLTVLHVLLARVFKTSSFANGVYQWSLPFVWLLWVLLGLFDLALAWNEGLTLERVAMLSIDVLLAWMTYREWKDNGDDRWKRLRKRVSSKVKNIRRGRGVVLEGPSANSAGAKPLGRG